METNETEITKKTRIKKISWLKFCKEFNTTNQFRRAEVIVKGWEASYPEFATDNAFLGLAVNVVGRSIEEIGIVATSKDPERPVESIVTVTKPVEIIVETDSNDVVSCLTLRGRDRMTVCLLLSGIQEPFLQLNWTKELAYSKFVQRGHTYGNDVDDWLEAEGIVESKVHNLV